MKIFRSFFAYILNWFRKFRKAFIIILGTTAILFIGANWIVYNKSKDFIYNDKSRIPECYTGIVLGARVSANGTPSDFLQDRLDKSIELYRNHKIRRFLLTGDHGRKSYDEVNHMKAYLISRDIPVSDIFLDHAGFDTYNSMVRAVKIFQVKNAIIITQEFHLPRAIYIARSKGLNAYGIKADNREYAGMKRLRIREQLAKVKAFIEVSLNRKPKFLGDTIPITGDSHKSYD